MEECKNERRVKTKEGLTEREEGAEAKSIYGRDESKVGSAEGEKKRFNMEEEKDDGEMVWS